MRVFYLLDGCFILNDGWHSFLISVVLWHSNTFQELGNNLPSETSQPLENWAHFVYETRSQQPTINIRLNREKQPARSTHFYILHNQSMLSSFGVPGKREGWRGYVPLTGSSDEKAFKSQTNTYIHDWNFSNVRRVIHAAMRPGIWHLGIHFQVRTIRK